MGRGGGKKQSLAKHKGSFRPGFTCLAERLYSFTGRAERLESEERGSTGGFPGIRRVLLFFTERPLLDGGWNSDQLRSWETLIWMELLLEFSLLFASFSLRLSYLLKYIWY